MIHRISKVCKHAELITPAGRSRRHRKMKLNFKQVPGKPSNNRLKHSEKMQANRRT